MDARTAAVWTIGARSIHPAAAGGAALGETAQAARPNTERLERSEAVRSGHPQRAMGESPPAALRGKAYAAAQARRLRRRARTSISIPYPWRARNVHGPSTNPQPRARRPQGVARRFTRIRVRHGAREEFP